MSLIGPVSEIRKIDPAGTQSVVARFDVPGRGPLGLAVSPAGKLYVAMSTSDPATQGVYRVLPDGGSVRLAGSDAIQFPNGIALDPRGNVYVTDSIGGSVWKISGNAPAQLWAQSPLLAGTGAFGLGFPLGANGIAVRDHRGDRHQHRGRKRRAHPDSPRRQCRDSISRRAGTGAVRGRRTRTRRLRERLRGREPAEHAPPS